MSSVWAQAGPDRPTALVVQRTSKAQVSSLLMYTPFRCELVLLQGLQLEGVYSSHGPSDVVLPSGPGPCHMANVSPVNNGTWAYDVCGLESRPTEASQSTDIYAAYGAPSLALQDAFAALT